MARFRLFRKREVLLPTTTGWLLVVATVLSLIFFFTSFIHSYLAPNSPVEAHVLVVEGWLPDQALKEIAVVVEREEYELVLTTGGELVTSSLLEEFKSSAELTRQTLLQIGLAEEIVIAVPSGQVLRDRTYSSAVALRAWMERTGMLPDAVNVVTLDAHARRSWSVFDDVLGESITVGIISIVDRRVEGYHWWQTSRGFDAVFGEIVALSYWWILGGM